MTKKQLPQLSPTETEILRLVWQLDKATVQEVCESLPAKLLRKTTLMVANNFPPLKSIITGKLTELGGRHRLPPLPF